MSITVLVVDDSPSVRKMLMTHLRVSGMTVHEAENGRMALEKAVEYTPDVILLDIMMPVMDGMEACKLLRENVHTASMYIIMLTAKSGVDDTVDGLDVGADDYMTKPFVPEELIARIKRGYRTAQDRRSALYDPLTKLLNRRSFDQIFEKEWARFARYGNIFSLLVLDIDHFKNVNDTYGHDVGDEVLQELASLLLKNLRDSDIACRWGGEEFVVFLAETSLSVAQHKADSLREKIAEYFFGQVGNLTVSIGIASPTADETADDMFKRADRALYKAKQEGRNRAIALVNDT